MLPGAKFHRPVDRGRIRKESTATLNRGRPIFLFYPDYLCTHCVALLLLSFILIAIFLFSGKRKWLSRTSGSFRKWLHHIDIGGEFTLQPHTTVISGLTGSSTWTENTKSKRKRKKISIIKSKIFSCFNNTKKGDAPACVSNRYCRILFGRVSSRRKCPAKAHLTAENVSQRSIISLPVGPSPNMTPPPLPTWLLFYSNFQWKRRSRKSQMNE